MSQEQGPEVMVPGPAPAAPWSAPDAGTGGGGAPPEAASAPPSGAEPVYREQPGGIPLRPLGIGELLDGTFSTIRRNPRATVGLAALLVTLQQAISVGAQVATGDLPTTTDFADESLSVTAIGGYGGIIGTLLAAVVGAVLTGMLVVVVSEDVLGRRATVGEVWRRVRPRLGALLVAATISGLLPYVGLIFLVVPGLILWAAWALTTPALILENLGPFAALRRSWRLAWPGLLRVWWTRALSVLLGMLIQLLVAFPILLITLLIIFGQDTGDGEQLPILAQAVITLGGIAVGAITAPFLAGVLALLYIDRRMRAEGLDLVLRREERTAGRRATAVPQPARGGGGP